MNTALKNQQDNPFMLAEDPGGFNWVWLYACNNNLDPSQIFVPERLVDYVFKRFYFYPNKYKTREELISVISEKNCKDMVCSTCGNIDADWKYMSAYFKLSKITSIIDAADNYTERFIDPINGQIISPTYMYVPSIGIKNIYRKIFRSVDISIFRHSFFEIYKSIYLNENNEDEKLSDILFIDEGIDRLKPAKSYLDNPDGHKGHIFRGRWALSKLIQCSKIISNEMKIDVLLHPNGNPNLYDFDGKILQNVNPWLRSRRYKLVVGMTSNLLGEIALLKIPTISILASIDDIKSCHHLETGGIRLCFDDESILQNLEKYFGAT